MQTSAQAIAKGIPFSVYGEALIIMSQNFIIIYLIWAYNKDLKATEKIGFFLFFAAYSFALFSPGMISDS
jgi:hypothetical protein